MFIVTTLFYLSLITIVGMVGLKLITLRKHKVSLPAGTVEEEFHSNVYQSFEGGWHIFRTKYLVRVRAFALDLFYMGAKEVLRFTSGLIHRLQARHGKLYDMVKGRGVLKKKGSVSFFLQDVAEYKKSLQDK